MEQEVPALPLLHLYIWSSFAGSVNRKALQGGIKPGWHYFGRKMDVADFEWAMWFTSFRNVILFALSGHVLFAKLSAPHDWNSLPAHTRLAPSLRTFKSLFKTHLFRSALPDSSLPSPNSC
uniref:Hedgehog acyltransferase like n=1 Tax=Sphenodon punctatus TaxID=8508 RepID=A0A8D0L1U2_SPHPU